MHRDGVRIRIVGDRAAVSDKLRQAWTQNTGLAANARTQMDKEQLDSRPLQIKTI
jgi:hypothetical protein